ncbi:hypothetical protein DW352_05765 [Pseudolabrys taiwanensis]|uniref:Uncharacterized protein n=1 Tax=Pseudolabrys taiwanensis TaxID=331696 RepID=A0A345ZT16_9HYPH|nr:hypothetical protein [Pseudolabrys taiwanensis]AXK80063.1 hypothetical protein DW352_05765 [Pseudolabrys taiwanensis]
MEEMPKKSRAFIEGECLKKIAKAWPSNDVQRVEIERLYPEGTGPNWRIRAMHPSLPPMAESEILSQVAHLNQSWALEDE